jgi:PAS domain S-box-containing protein
MESSYRFIDELDALPTAPPFGVLIFDSTGGLRHASQGFLSMLAMSADEAHGFGWTERLTPEYRRAFERWKLDGRQKREWDVELQFDDGHGKRRTYLIRGIAMAGDSPNRETYAAMFADITRRKQQETDANYSRDFSEAIIQTLATPLVVLHSNQRIITANAAFYALYPGGRNRIDGEPIHRFVGALDGSPILGGLIDVVLSSGESFSDVRAYAHNNDRAATPLSIGGRRLLSPGRHEPLALLAISVLRGEPDPFPITIPGTLSQ